MDTSYYIAARDELFSRIEDLFFKPVYRYFQKAWVASGNISDNRDQQIAVFRKKIMNIRDWSTTMIHDEYQNVSLGKDSLFDLLLTRTFTINARILTFAADIPPSYITIHVPDNQRFVHMVYLNTAREFYMNPWLFVEDDTYKRVHLIKNTINASINRTFRDLQSLDSIFNGTTGNSSVSGSQSNDNSSSMDYRPINGSVVTAPSFPPSLIDDNPPSEQNNFPLDDSKTVKSIPIGVSDLNDDTITYSELSENDEKPVDSPLTNLNVNITNAQPAQPRPNESTEKPTGNPTNNPNDFQFSGYN